jgi:hypothetical protein
MTYIITTSKFENFLNVCPNHINPAAEFQIIENGNSVSVTPLTKSAHAYFSFKMANKSNFTK